jgi:hypothetical protein
MDEKTKLHYKNYLAFLENKNKEDNQKEILSAEDLCLRKSLNTQTEVLPKPSFKEFSNNPVFAKITAELEINDHDGDCSGNECIYTKQTVEVNAILPEEYSALCPQIGECIDFKNPFFEYNWTKHLPLPNINIYGAHTCHCKKINGVSRHQYKYTLKHIAVVENKNYKKTSIRGYLLMQNFCYDNGLHAVVDTLSEAKEIAKEKKCKIYDLDTLKYVPIKK